MSTGQLVTPKAAPVVRVNVLLHRRRRSVARPRMRLVTLPRRAPETRRHALGISSHPTVVKTKILSSARMQQSDSSYLQVKAVEIAVKHAPAECVRLGLVGYLSTLHMFV